MVKRGKKSIPWGYWIVWALGIIALILLGYGIVKNLLA